MIEKETCSYEHIPDYLISDEDSNKIEAIDKHEIWKKYLLSVVLIFAGICISAILGNKIFDIIVKYDEEIQQEVYPFALMNVRNMCSFFVQSVGNVMASVGIVLHVIVVQQMIKPSKMKNDKMTKNWLYKQFREKWIMLMAILLLAYDLCMPARYLYSARLWIRFEQDVDIVRYILCTVEVSIVAKYVVCPLAMLVLLCAIYNAMTEGRHTKLLNAVSILFAGGVLLDVGIKSIKNEFYLVLTCLVIAVVLVSIHRKAAHLIRRKQ